MDIEVVARGYRYYRWEDGQFVGYNGGPIGTSNDPRDFFSLVVVTVCKTNIVCCGKKQPDEIDRIVSEPLQRDGLGVFIRQGAGDIETTVDRFKPSDPCYVGEDLVTWVKRETTPGRIDPRLPRR